MESDGRIIVTKEFERLAGCQAALLLAQFEVVEKKLLTRIELLESKVRELEVRELEAVGRREGASESLRVECRTILSRLAHGASVPLRSRLVAYSVEELSVLCAANYLPTSAFKADLVNQLATARVDPLEMDLVRNFKLAELRDACEVKGLPTSGAKVDLARRLLK